MELDHVSSLSLVAFVSLLAAISPGPDFAIVVRNNLVYSRRKGFFTSFGVCAALLIHLFYTLVGIGVLIASNAYLFSLIKYIGAAYLIYLGVSGILASLKMSSVGLQYEKSAQEISDCTAFRQGFLTNMLNPKCAMFFVSLFSQFITADTPVLLRIEFAVINWTIGLGWFLFLSYIITCQFLTSRINQFRKAIDRVMGSFLVILGIRMLFI
ncbi:MAG: LysE family translocator [Verrucomicrobia bacterium]|nr:LysE family translocator [Verrucomicrobiota bacterium]